MGASYLKPNARGGPMKELVEEIARALVDHPEGVEVKAVEGSQVTVLELRVHPEDLGKVIGRQGRTAKAIRTLLGAAGMKLHKRFTLEILEVERSRRTKAALDPGGPNPQAARQQRRSRCASVDGLSRAIHDRQTSLSCKGRPRASSRRGAAFLDRSQPSRNGRVSSRRLHLHL